MNSPGLTSGGHDVFGSCIRPPVNDAKGDLLLTQLCYIARISERPLGHKNLRHLLDQIDFI